MVLCTNGTVRRLASKKIRLFTLLIQLVTLLQATGSIDETYVDNVVNHCENKVKRFAATEEEIYGNRGGRKKGEPLLFGQLIPEHLYYVNKIEQNQRIFECISDTLNGYRPQNLEASYSYRKLVQTCISNRPVTPQCDPSYPYKMINGTCNNLFNPKWGSAFECVRRLFPANYEGVSGMRKSVQGKRSLPQPRHASLKIVKTRSRPSKSYNSLFVIFAQFVAHDIAEFMFTTADGNETLDCCKHARTKDQHPQCAPILLRPNDPFYSSKNISCFNFARMAPCPSCSVDKRIPITHVSSYIDCSLVYGQTDDRAQKLRRYDGSGKLTSQYREAGEFLPALDSQSARCERGIIEKQHYCVKSGDTRVNQHTLIALFHTIFLREHNRIADKLKLLNPHWCEEKLFQESRKILIAEFQVIVYKEFLPVLLGPHLMDKYGLRINSGSRYDYTVDPTISVEFNAAAFRIHSLIPSRVVPDEQFKYFRSLYINLTPLYNNRTSSYLTKMANYPAEEYGSFMPKDLTHWLYKEKDGSYGFDLAAVDIQRGRDVGIPTYAQMLEYTGKTSMPITEFDHLDEYLVPECIKYLKKTYANVRDIDLWVALNCERIPDNMIISPTAADIIAEQFTRLKVGDRFYFEHDYTLTHEQRQTLLDASLAKLLCDNSKIDAIQPMSLLFQSLSNIALSCSSIPGVDLEKWRDI